MLPLFLNIVFAMLQFIPVRYINCYIEAEG